MPTYEYRCPKGHEFEKFQKMSDPPVAGCPECGADAERLLSTGAGLIFKGSGFYITDYRGDSYKKAAEAEKGGGSSDNGTGSGGPDSGGTTSTGSKTEGNGTAEGKGSASGKASSGSGSGSTVKKDTSGGGGD